MHVGDYPAVKSTLSATWDENMSVTLPTAQIGVGYLRTVRLVLSNAAYPIK